jgi:undecaprenyl-diphosphatase
VRTFSKAGEHGVLWYSISGLGALLARRRRAAYARVAAVVFGSFLANQAVKIAVRRPRPKLEDLPPLVHTLSNRSYPSAHATTSMAAAGALKRVLPAKPVYALAALMSLSRLYLGVHYPSDIVAGAALGVAVEELAP